MGMSRPDVTASIGNHPASNPRFDECVTLRVWVRLRVRSDDGAPTHDDTVFRPAMPAVEERERGQAGRTAL